MPSAANITVKKNDGTTDVTFTLIAPAGGDSSPAYWRNTAIGGPMSGQPSLTMSSRWNSNKTVRRMDAELVYPEIYDDTNTGLTKVGNVCKIAITAGIPVGMDMVFINEAVSQAVNLFASTLSKDALKAGSAPT